MIASVFAISVRAFAIGNNNPITTTEQLSYDGTIVAVDGQIFEFTSENVIYKVHVPQYVVLSDLNIEIDQTVSVIGYLKISSCDNIIYPTIINGVTLEDLKPLDGTGKI